MIFVNLTVASRCGDSKADRRDEFLPNKHAKEKERERDRLRKRFVSVVYFPN